MAVPTKLQQWREYVARDPQRPDQLNARQLAALTPAALEAYNEQRFAWLSADVVLGTPDVRRMRRLWATLRAETLYAPSMTAKTLSVSGAPTYGKTTAATWIARDHEREERLTITVPGPSLRRASAFAVCGDPSGHHAEDADDRVLQRTGTSPHSRKHRARSL